MREYFTNSDYQNMARTRQTIADTLLPVADTIEASVPSFDGFALFQQDAYHPDSAGSIVQINATGTPYESLAFQRANITDRRVDLSVSTLGDTFNTGNYTLAESRMNPEQHLVAGLVMPAAVGKRAAAVCQIAFTKQRGTPSLDDLSQIRHYWREVQGEVSTHLETLHRYAQRFPNQSVSDALQLDVPTTPNAFVINWDTSHSREQAKNNYGKLRYDLTLRGQRFLDIIAMYNGTYMRPSGDGQSFALEIPASEYDRLSEASIRKFAQIALYPLLNDLMFTAKHDSIGTPVRFAVELGRIEPTTFDDSSPALFALADVSAQQSHDRVTLGFGQRAMDTLQLTPAHIASFNA